MPLRMISVQQLTKRFGSQVAVESLSFEVPAGQIVGFLGPNGAGKTTTLKMLTGMLEPTSGTATLCGFDLRTQTVMVVMFISMALGGIARWAWSAGWFVWMLAVEAVVASALYAALRVSLTRARWRPLE